MEKENYLNIKELLFKRTHTRIRTEVERMNCLLVLEDIQSNLTPKDMITVQFEANHFLKNFSLTPFYRLTHYESTPLEQFKIDYISFLLERQINIIVFHSNLNPADMEDSRVYEFLYENTFDNTLIVIPTREVIVAKKWFFRLPEEMWNFHIDDFSKN